jgi:hypothetical protein
MFQVANNKQIFSPNLWEEQSFEGLWQAIGMFKFEYLEYKIMQTEE